MKSDPIRCVTLEPNTVHLSANQQQTETLKNLFVLYFSILKFPGRSPLLPAALAGISHFAHLINVDFFRDLLLVFKSLIRDDGSVETSRKVDVRTRLLCIIHCVQGSFRTRRSAEHRLGRLYQHAFHPSPDRRT